MSNQKILHHFYTGQSNNTYLNYWVDCYCSSNKTDMVQLFKNIFAFIRVKFQQYSKKFESLLWICRIFTFSLIQEYHFNDHFVRFHHVGLRYHILIVSSTCVNIRADSKWISAVQRWKSNVSELRKSALNSADSEKIRADQRWCLSCSLNQRWKRQNYATALFSGDYLRDFNPGSAIRWQ